jgi:heptosyltransferase-2
MVLPRRTVFQSRAGYALAVCAELGAPVLRFLSTRVTGAQTPPKQWRQGLILGHTHIGDVLFRTASLPHLARALPECEWHYLSTTESAQVLAGNPHLSSVLPLVDGNRSWQLKRGSVSALRQRRFDVALCTNAVRYYDEPILATALGIPNRVGFVFKGLTGLVSHPVPAPYPSPSPAYFRAMVAHLGNFPPEWELRPQLHPSRSDIDAAEDVWRELALGRTPVVVCALTTRQRTLTWPPSRFLDVLALARRRRDFEVVLSGAAADADFLNDVARRAPVPCHVAAGRLSLVAFAVFLSRCAALLTVDSGPRHLANAVRTPVVFVRNLGVERFESSAYCDTEFDVTPEVGSLPTDEQRAVLFAIDPGSVATRLITLLGD